MYLFVKPKVANWTYTLVIDQKAWGKKSPIYLLLSNLTDIMMNIFIYLQDVWMKNAEIGKLMCASCLFIPMESMPMSGNKNNWEFIKNFSSIHPSCLKSSCFSKSLFSYNITRLLKLLKKQQLCILRKGLISSQHENYVSTSHHFPGHCWS